MTAWSICIWIPRDQSSLYIYKYTIFCFYIQPQIFVGWGMFLSNAARQEEKECHCRKNKVFFGKQQEYALDDGILVD
ncbi:hypothetical protein CV945_15430 [Geobacillus sp. Manikaran-105]|nr:hypothetical protein CV945_15430 [Geobacillus sp. Manikaran-105]